MTPHHEAAFNRSMAQSQAKHDAQMPEEDWDCDEDGHQWRRLSVVVPDGTTFRKCLKCGMVDEN